MALRLNEIKDSGDFMRERAVFSVDTDCELGKFLVAHSRIINETAFSSKLQNIFWFPDKHVSAGDLVVLYTKKGENNVAVNGDGSKTHFYYWGLDTPLSKNGERLCIVLLDANWSVSEIPSIQTEN